MANQQDVEQIRLGVEAWNAWRQGHPDHVPDLSGADLLGVDLEQGNLSRANLTRARLGGASLIEADLREAVLISADLSATQAQGANLSGANLVGANLQMTLLQQANLSRADLLGADFASASLHAAILWAADLSDANLSEADLSHADLLGTNLSGADLGGTLFRGTNLQGTSFRQAKIGYTVWSDVNLGLARGLETARHFGPSTVGTDTLLRSQGQLPELFLQEAGLTRAFLPSEAVLAESPIEYATCVISATHEDQAFSSRLCADLRDRGLRCWLASNSQEEREEAGSPTDRGEAPYRCDQMLLVLSTHAMHGAWVANALATAFARESQQERRVLFVLRLDDAVLQTCETWAMDLRRMRPISDFHDWQQKELYQKALSALLGQLTAGGKRP